MLRLLAASCRPLLAGNHLARQAQSSATTQLFHSTTSRQGLEEFFETPLQEGDKPRTGKEWTAADLRRKSWEDLHKLWYVLLKERNMLASEQMRRKARGEKMPNATRCSKVKKSMARIKLVLTERAIATPNPRKSEAMRAMINS